MYVKMNFVFGVCLYLICSGMIFTTVHAENEINAPSSHLATATSEQRVNFDNVYGIEIELPIAGDIELSAVEGNEVVIKLEKLGEVVAGRTDEDSVKGYLDAVTLDASKVDDILQLKLNLPEASDGIVKLTRVNCFIETPPDVSLKVRTTDGNIRVNGIRGEIELETEIGNVHLKETTGKYRVNVGEGRIYGKIFLTGGDDAFKTQSGAIDLVILDEVATAMDVTAIGGGISLRLPENFAAEMELETASNDQHAITIDLPVEIENAFVGDMMRAWLNGGGPLLRLKASDRIAILALDSETHENETDADENQNSHLQLMPKIIEPPRIDGVLFEKAWSKAVPLSAFYKADGTDTANEPTQAFLMWDDSFLYIGIKAYDSQMEHLRISQTEKDSAVWDDDALEVLIDPNPATSLYYDLIINPIGTVFDQVIKSDYPVDLRFAPVGDKRRRTDDIPPKSVADPAWDSLARIRTQITSRFWSVEIALPLAAMESISPKDWNFSLHRKAQHHREYSHWPSTDDTGYPWWPHEREQMAKLRRTDGNPQDTPVAEKLEIAAIELDGNKSIPTSEILQLIPFQPGDVVTINELSWLKRELADSSWFREMRLETSAANPNSDEYEVGATHASPPRTEEANIPPFKVTVHIHVTEHPTRIAKGLDLRRNRFFHSRLLREWFKLDAGRLALDELNIKEQLITQLYRNHGYKLAEVSHQFFDNYLLIDIDEGHLDEIRFVGNKQISLDELTASLGLRPGHVYHQTQGEVQINLMQTRLSQTTPYFKAIENWEVKQEGNKNVLIVEVKERSLTNWSVLPRINFSRVHGLILGGNGEIATAKNNGGRAFGSLSNGLASSVWNYQLGGEKIWFSGRPLITGGSVYRLTDILYDAALSTEEEFLASAIFGDSTLDYYQRQGYQAWLTQILTPSTNITLEFTDDKHQNLSRSTNWSLFDRRTPKHRNKRIDEGDMRSISATFWFDNRDHKSYQRKHFRVTPGANPLTRRGWRGYFSVEYTDEQLKSDFDFTRYDFQVIRYNPLFRRHNLDFRMWGSFSDTHLPRQRLLYLGNIGTLRGYDLNEFIGDNMLLLNVEYRMYFGQLGDPENPGAIGGVATIFLDTGDAWFDDERFELDRLNTSVGVGLSLFSGVSAGMAGPGALRIEVARALRENRNVRLTLRLSQLF